MAALTFDDGPSDLSSRLLDLLAQKGAKATFFWEGKNVSQFPQTVLRAIAEGHTVGQHSWDHPHVAQMKAADLSNQQIKPTMREFSRVSRHRPRYYRPPFGDITWAQADFLKKKEIVVIGWSITSLDWDEARILTDAAGAFGDPVARDQQQESPRR